MKVYEFEAEIQEGRGGGAFVAFPFDARQEFGTGGQVKIKATFDGVEYRGSLVPMGGGLHALGIRKDIRSEIAKGIGELVTVTLARDDAPRTVTVPSDLKAALDADGRVAEAFERLSYTRRKGIVSGLETAVKPETRERRLQKSLKELIS